MHTKYEIENYYNLDVKGIYNGNMCCETEPIDVV